VGTGAIRQASVELIDTIAGEKILDTAAVKMNTSRLKTKEAGLSTGLFSQRSRVAYCAGAGAGAGAVV
jgi:hypothetical protein